MTTAIYAYVAVTSLVFLATVIVFAVREYRICLFFVDSKRWWEERKYLEDRNRFFELSSEAISLYYKIDNERRLAENANPHGGSLSDVHRYNAKAFKAEFDRKRDELLKVYSRMQSFRYDTDICIPLCVQDAVASEP